MATRVRDGIGFCLEHSLVRDTLARILLHTCATGRVLEKVVVFYWPQLARGIDHWRTFTACAAIGNLSQDGNLLRSICLRRRWESSRGKNRRHSGLSSARSARCHWRSDSRRKARWTLRRGTWSAIWWAPTRRWIRQRGRTCGELSACWRRAKPKHSRCRSRGRDPMPGWTSAGQASSGWCTTWCKRRRGESRLCEKLFQGLGHWANRDWDVWITYIVFAAAGNLSPDKNRWQCICSRRQSE